MKTLWWYTDLDKKKIKQEISNVIKIGRIDTSNYCRLFEKKIEKFLKVKHVIAVNNGSMANVLVFMALGLKNNDEIIIPNIGWISVINSCKILGLKPVLIEVDPRRPLLSVSEIEKNIQKLKLLIKEDQTVDIDMVQKHIGFSKEYNLFELTDAIAAMNVQKAGFIAHHFGKNNKNHPIVVTISHLYGFFTKLMKFHFYKEHMNDQQISGKIGVHPFFLKQYKQAASYYNKSKLAQILSHLRHYDLMSKGVIVPNISEKEILKEMIFKIMH